LEEKEVQSISGDDITGGRKREETDKEYHEIEKKKKCSCVLYQRNIVNLNTSPVSSGKGNG
jgi:hypothetical protein